MYSLIQMSESVRERLDGVRVYGCHLQLTPLASRGKIEMAEDWGRIHEQWRGSSKAAVAEHPRIAAYYDFYAQLGLNPKKSPPSVQNMIQRFFIRDELDKLPIIHPIVDIVNVAALTHLIPLGVFDAHAVEGQLRLTFTEGGEPFQGLGEGAAEPLSADVLVLADEEKVLSRFCYRDGESQKITPLTETIWLLGCQVPGIEEQAVYESLDAAQQFLQRAYRTERLDTTAAEDQSS